MRIRLVGKNLNDIRPLLPRFGMEEAEKDFELVITHGGDGALLGAERDYPGVLKLPIRDAGTAPTCSLHTAEKQLSAYREGKLAVTTLPKLEGIVNGRSMLAINDLCVRNADPASALRYRVRINGALYANEIVGDGAVLSSVHGSSAYYRSITHSIFRVGIGLAFSNSTEAVSHLVLDDNAIIELEIIRGPGVLVADNAPERPLISERDIVLLRQCAAVSRICGLTEFMCPRCRQLRHPGKISFSGVQDL